MRIVRAVPSDPGVTEEEGSAGQQSVVGVRIMGEALDNIVQALQQFQNNQRAQMLAADGTKRPSIPMALLDIV